jgi:hypothetical protein
VREVTGGEVRGASEVEQVKLHLMVALGEARGGQRGLVGVGAEAAAEVIDGEVVPAGDGWN